MVQLCLPNESGNETQKAQRGHERHKKENLLCNKDAIYSFLDKVFGTAHSPPRRGEVSATSKTKGSVPICRGRGGQFGTPSKASRTDHYYGFALLRSRFAPVCAAFVASRHFLDGAATFEASPYRARAPRPPLRGGEYDALKFRPNGYIIDIGLRLRRAMPFVVRYRFRWAALELEEGSLKAQRRRNEIAFPKDV